MEENKDTIPPAGSIDEQQQKCEGTQLNDVNDNQQQASSSTSQPEKQPNVVPVSQLLATSNDNEAAQKYVSDAIADIIDFNAGEQSETTTTTNNNNTATDVGLAPIDAEPVVEKADADVQLGNSVFDSISTSVNPVVSEPEPQPVSNDSNTPQQQPQEQPQPVDPLTEKEPVEQQASLVTTEVTETGAPSGQNIVSNNSDNQNNQVTASTAAEKQQPTEENIPSIEAATTKEPTAESSKPGALKGALVQFSDNTESQLEKVSADANDHADVEMLDVEEDTSSGNITEEDISVISSFFGIEVERLTSFEPEVIRQLGAKLNEFEQLKSNSAVLELHFEQFRHSSSKNIGSLKHEILSYKEKLTALQKKETELEEKTSSLQSQLENSNSESSKSSALVQQYILKVQELVDAKNANF
ncbi:unnamed protein product [Ambrosiozyma monospora]|uniref:Unnamed protein product n=1 Tax=Ambrosiozyma monospora TaxID=43982 RepID=A0ACB5TBR2_AMBMO|nr:unnamed protein product [Ambrosiozyma monospora]